MKATINKLTENAVSVRSAKREKNFKESYTVFTKDFKDAIEARFYWASESGRVSCCVWISPNKEKYGHGFSGGWDKKCAYDNKEHALHIALFGCGVELDTIPGDIGAHNFIVDALKATADALKLGKVHIHHAHG